MNSQFSFVKMKTLKVRKIDCRSYDAADIPALFASEQVPYHTIGSVNWPSCYPYLPDVSFAVAHNGDSILLHYKVSENSVKGDFDMDFDKVWEDSCCEFFVAPADDGLYYNIEFNCVGALYLCVGDGRTDRQRAPGEVLDSISRWTSLGRSAIGLKYGRCDWESALVLPAKVFFAHSVRLDGAGMKCNFYKCGNTDNKHYVSYYPVATPLPDFHRPEFFGKIEFE